MSNELLDLIREKFTICHETGEIISNRTGKVYTGLDSYGYIQVRVGKKMMKGHTIVWLSYHGTLPTKSLDHIDRNKTNNSIHNLREACPRLQKRNADLGDGITKRNGRYRARIRDWNSKQHEFYSDSYEDALAWRRAKEIEYGYET